MNCANVKRYLALYLDSELGPETTFEITSHLEECADCRRVAALEERLENRIRASLIREQSDDDVLWSRSVQRFKRSQTRPRRRLFAMVATGLAIGTTAMILWFTGVPLVHDELDLAEATAAAHEREFVGRAAPLTRFSNPAEVDEYFRRELSPAYCLNVDTGSGMSLRGGSVCEVGNVQAAHVICADSEMTLSLFWFPSDKISQFPETVARFQEHGTSFHCHVDPYEFFVKRAGAGIVVGIAETTPAKLERLVGEAAVASCDRNH